MTCLWKRNLKNFLFSDWSCYQFCHAAVAAIYFRENWCIEFIKCLDTASGRIHSDPLIHQSQTIKQFCFPDSRNLNLSLCRLLPDVHRFVSIKYILGCVHDKRTWTSVRKRIAASLVNSLILPVINLERYLYFFMK